MTPAKTDLQNLREKIRALNSLFNEDRLSLSASDIPQVIVILGSSRSGSSLLFHLLSQSGAFWAPQGEETPFYRVNGLGWVTAKEQSDALRAPIDIDTRDQIFEFLIRDLGRRPAAINSTYLSQCATRLLLQWPELGLNPENLADVIRTNARNATDATSLWLNLTARLNLEPGFYDLPGPKSRNLQLEIPRYVLEEPPYILPTPRETPTAETLKTAPLLLKTSTNAYRLPWLKTLFPFSEIRFVILGRNPAASINGLMDGWLSNAFHSHNLDFVHKLAIRGYSDVMAYGDRWWKFDLPPGWSDFDDAPLPDVCAFQWRSAYKHIFENTGDAKVLHVKSEDLLSPQKSAAALQAIFAFAGTSAVTPVDALRTRPVMASQSPGPARWRQREDVILPLLEHPEVKGIAQQLGYDLSSSVELV
ncbi:MAG: hypothetical protein KF799_02715 [Bdellovibrionales bacterium]|nr:hypothetical protein [Bdellovibrionales bacterium]